jgi:hypothetical protein
MSSTVMNCLRDTVKSRPWRVVARTPSPLQGEGWGEGGRSQARLRLLVSNRLLSLALKELLAARLSPQAGKSAVISPKGEGTIVWGVPAYRFPHQQEYEGGIAEHCPAYRQETKLIET